jgi:hypothetical protein
MGLEAELPQLTVMAEAPPSMDQLKALKFILNAVSVASSPKQFFQLCSDNPELRSRIHGPERDHRSRKNPVLPR